MAKHSYSRGAGADGAFLVVLGFVLCLRLFGIVFRAVVNHFFNPFILGSFLLCLLSAAGLGLTIGWQWVDNNWWYWNIYLYNIPYIAAGVLAVSIVVFVVCCVIVETYFDDMALPDSEDLTEVMSNKWKY